MKRGLLLSIIATVLAITGVYTSKMMNASPVNAEQTLQGVSVVLDAGHGGFDNGASWGGVNEDDLNLKITYAIKEELEARGATVYMTREDDQDMTQRDHHYSKQDDMYLRVRQIDAFDANYLLSIHLNASPATSAWGSQVFYYNRSENGKILANDIHESMKEVTGSRKNISGANFHVLRATKTLGVLIECGFISNGNERGQLSSSAHHKKLAVSIANGLEKYHSEAPPIEEEGMEEIENLAEAEGLGEPESAE